MTAGGEVTDFLLTAASKFIMVTKQKVLATPEDFSLQYTPYFRDNAQLKS